MGNGEPSPTKWLEGDQTITHYEAATEGLSGEVLLTVSLTGDGNTQSEELLRLPIDLDTLPAR